MRGHRAIVRAIIRHHSTSGRLAIGRHGMHQDSIGVRSVQGGSALLIRHQRLRCRIGRAVPRHFPGVTTAELELRGPFCLHWVGRRASRQAIAVRGEIRRARRRRSAPSLDPCKVGLNRLSNRSVSRAPNPQLSGVSVWHVRCHRSGPLQKRSSHDPLDASDSFPPLHRPHRRHLRHVAALG